MNVCESVGTALPLCVWLDVTVCVDDRVRLADCESVWDNEAVCVRVAEELVPVRIDLEDGSTVVYEKKDSES